MIILYHNVLKNVRGTLYANMLSANLQGTLGERSLFGGLLPRTLKADVNFVELIICYGVMKVYFMFQRIVNKLSFIELPK